MLRSDFTDEPLMSTYDLIVQTLKGDQSAAQALVKILTPIFAKEAQFAIWRIRGTPEDVKELVNDIFADLFEGQAAALRRYDPEKRASPEGYFRGFARLRCMGFARDERNRVFEQLMDPSDVGTLQAGSHPEQESVQDLDAQRRLQQILDLLSPPDQELFRLKITGQETEAICEALGINREVYFQRVHRMLGRLQQQGLLAKEYRGRKTNK
jgi:RNA polymerase sigma factor (sigma-70 family)